ncbi:MAG TPA: hypothetical protein VFN77_11340, partial [Acetobacteraceae bacterium]|nr:hypothetical protein [Acetobacteraceae bacterium]
AWPFYCLLGIALASLGIGLWRAVIEPQVRWALIFVSCWVFLDIFALLGVIGALAERRQVRLMARINCHKVLWIRPAGGEWREARSFNLSRYGAGIVLPGDFAPVEEGGEVELLFDDPRGGLGGTVQYLDTRDGQRILGVRYRLGSLAEVRFAVAAAFGSSASLVRTSGLRHRGVSVLYAFGFFVRIGLLGARRHLALLAMPWKKRSGSPDAETALPSSRSAA